MPDNIEQILKVEKPRTKKQFRSFLGATGNYKAFVPNYAATAVALTVQRRSQGRTSCCGARRWRTPIVSWRWPWVQLRSCSCRIRTNEFCCEQTHAKTGSAPYYCRSATKSWSHCRILVGNCSPWRSGTLPSGVSTYSLGDGPVPSVPRVPVRQGILAVRSPTIVLHR